MANSERRHPMMELSFVDTIANYPLFWAENSALTATAVSMFERRASPSALCRQKSRRSVLTGQSVLDSQSNVDRMY
jgi:hypothetical protein